MLLLMLLFSDSSLAASSGTCGYGYGTNLTWTLDDNGLLTISGTGDMLEFDYNSTSNWRNNTSVINKVVIENGVTSIGSRAFEGCSNLTRITIPTSVTSIGNATFSKCTSLTSISIPDSVTSIGNSAFNSCTSLTSITIPNNITRIGNSAFTSCTNLTNITIPESVTAIDNYAFSCCSNLTSILIPASVNIIGISAFSGCKNLTSIVLIDGIRYINSYAFENCDKLTNITLPSSITSIGECAFKGCSNLSSIIVDEFNTAYQMVDGFLLTKDGKQLLWCSPKRSGDTAIPNNVTRIDKYSFYECSNLTGITIPDSVTRIDENAFYGCKNLTSITIPDSVTRIEGGVFSNCSSLTSITIPDSVTSIGYYAFSGCNSLPFVIVSSLTSNKAKLVSRAGAYFFTSEYPELKFRYLYSNEEEIGMSVSAASKDLENVVIPQCVTSVDNSAFSGCSNLTSILIPNSVTNIGNYAFNKCSNLTNVMIPESVTSIGYGAFSGCSNLTDITILNSVTVINGSAIPSSVVICCYMSSSAASYAKTNGNTCAYLWLSGNCGENLLCALSSDGLLTISGYGEMYSYNAASDVPWNSQASYVQTVRFEGDVTSISSYAFSGCSSLMSITIPNNITSIGNYTFFNCSSLRSITIPNNVTSIGNYTFSGCRNLTDIIIPDSITSIGQRAFNNVPYVTVSSLNGNTTRLVNEVGAFFSTNEFPEWKFRYSYSNETITDLSVWAIDKSTTTAVIPQGVTNIGDSAFSGCNKLTSITIPDSITNIGGYAFSSCSKLTSITIPNSVTSIGQCAFSGCSSLTSILIPNSVTTISEQVFANCTSLIGITIPNSVTSIDKRAFYGCRNLKNITIPENVITIGDEAFSYCNQLAKVYFLGNQLTFGNNMFTVFPTFYCYEYSGADSYAIDQNITRIYLDHFVPDSERTLTLDTETLFLEYGETAALYPVVCPDYDHPVIHWTSNNTNVATVSDGTVTGVGAGSCTITATVGNVSASVEVTVHMYASDFTFDQDEIWTVAKEPLTLIPHLVPEGSTAEFTWSSTNTVIATVNSAGVVTTKTPGDVTILATTEKNIAHGVLLHVCYPVTAVSFETNTVSIPNSGIAQLIANVTMRTQNCVNHLVTFTSSKPSIVSVDSKTGMVTAHNTGTATITATSASGITAQCSVTVRAANILTLPSGLTKIESEAFAGLNQVDQIVIPATVTFIASDAFTDSNVMLVVPADSYAESWAVENGVDHITR